MIASNFASLNPCCNGRWSRTAVSFPDSVELTTVLILVVMEDGLVLFCVLAANKHLLCLNPCCNGRWSRTLAS